MKRIRLYLFACAAITLSACKKTARTTPVNVLTAVGEVSLAVPDPTLLGLNFSKVTGWPAGKMPAAPKGYAVSLFAGGLINPRNLFVAPGGDVFVAESNTEIKGWKKWLYGLAGYTGAQRSDASANRILLLRDADHDGVAETRSVYLTGLTQPYGITIIKNHFYVAAMNAIWKYPYRPGQLHMRAKGIKIADLPAGGYNNHWTRNLAAGPSGQLYVSVGSGSNIAEHGMENEQRRANILSIAADGGNEKTVASGLRNPNGIAVDPLTGKLWTVVNERDGLGDDLVPDYLTEVHPGGFYGWPYSYYGGVVDERVAQNRPDLVKKAIVPDVALGAHTASLSIAFSPGDHFKGYESGVFIAQHGSWNRSRLAGYKVVFVPFRNGRPAQGPRDFLTGFVRSRGERKVYGRPAGLAIAADGSLLVADDSGNKIWRISYRQSAR